MAEFSYTIKDPNGIHARPAGELAKELQKFQSSITVTLDDKSADGKKVFALMKLRAKVGNIITVKAEGPDAEEAAASAKAFLEAKM